MIICNHVVAGGLIGVALQGHPVAAFAVGMASHFVLDAIPHWGIDPTREDGEAYFISVAKKDGCAGCALLGATWWLSPDKLSMAAAMVGSCLPDLDKPYEYFTKKKLFPAWFRRFHGRIQTESESRGRQEIVTLVGGLVVLGFVLWRSRH